MIEPIQLDTMAMPKGGGVQVVIPSEIFKLANIVLFHKWKSLLDDIIQTAPSEVGQGGIKTG